jgi:hypothetical protein
VNEAVYAAQVNERTKVDDRGNDTLANLALGEVCEERGAAFALSLLEERTARKHNVVAVLVEFENLRFDLLAEVRREVANATKLDEGCGQEAAQSDVDDESTLDNFDDRTCNDSVVVLDLLNVAPRTLVLSTLLGEDQAAFFVFLLEDEGFNGVADLNNFGGVDIVLDGKFAGGDYTLGLITDVEENLVTIDFDDGALDEVSIVEKLKSLFDRGEEVFCRSDVIDRYLLGCLGGRYECHVVSAPVWTLIGPRRGVAVLCSPRQVDRDANATLKHIVRLQAEASRRTRAGAGLLSPISRASQRAGCRARLPRYRVPSCGMP